MTAHVDLEQRIRAALAERDYPGAHEACTELLRLQPNSASAVEGLALCAFECADFEAAAAYFGRLARQFPNEADRWFRLGVASLKAGDGLGAVQAWQEAVRLQPDHQGAWINIGAYFWNTNDLSAAREAWENAAARGACPDALFNLGLLAEREGRLESAAGFFRQAVEQEGPVPAEAWFLVGMQRLAAGDAAGSVDALTRALRIRPDWLEASLNAGIANWQAGQRDAAVACFRQVLRRDPDSRVALQCLAALAVEAGDLDLALDCHARLSQAGEASPEFFYNTALLLHRTGQLEDAEVLYRRVLEARPDFREALLNLGHVLASRGDESGARDCWKVAAA